MEMRQHSTRHQQQVRLQGTSRDVRRDPRFQQPPPEYSHIQQHRWQQSPAQIEIKRWDLPFNKA